MMFVGLCGVSETTMWHSRQASASTFPHVSLFTNMMIVRRRSLYGVFSDGHAFGLLAPLPPPVSIGFTQEANISLEAGFGQILSLSAVFVGVHSRYQSNLIPVPPSKRPLCCQGFILTFYFLDLCFGPFPDAYIQYGIGVANENADVCLMCFPGRTGLLPIRRVLSPPHSGSCSFMLPYS